VSGTHALPIYILPIFGNIKKTIIKYNNKKTTYIIFIADFGTLIITPNNNIIMQNIKHIIPEIIFCLFRERGFIFFIILPNIPAISTKFYLKNTLPPPFVL
jgi:hypothetical protein